MQSFNDLAILANGPLSLLVRDPPLSSRSLVIRTDARILFSLTPREYLRANLVGLILAEAN